MNATVNNMQDVIDSRDVIERIEELREAIEAYAEKMDDWQENADNVEELEALEALAKEASGYAPDWEHGETLIRDSYFEEYAEQLADDIGAINSDATWPNNFIDWEAAARVLQMDYTSVEFDGVTYWIR